MQALVLLGLTAAVAVTIEMDTPTVEQVKNKESFQGYSTPYNAYQNIKDVLFHPDFGKDLEDLPHKNVQGLYGLPAYDYFLPGSASAIKIYGSKPHWRK